MSDPEAPSTPKSDAKSPATAIPGSVRSLTEMTCKRSLEFDVIRFTWNIENFSFHKDSRGVQYDVLESPHFTSDDGKYEWILRLILHPRPDRPGDKQCKEYIQVFLNLYNAPRELAHLKCQFVFLRSTESNKEDQTYQIGRFREFRRGETWGFRRFILRHTLFDPKNGFVADDRLTVRVNLDIIRGAHDEINRSVNPFKVRENIQPTLESLFLSRDHSDIVLVTKDSVEVKAHKCILSTRSPVFRAMLTHDLEETRTNRVEVSDVRAEVMETFLKILYLGASSTEVMEGHAASLLILGDKYQVSDVKDKAIDVLRRAKSCSNATDLLMLADLHNAPDLKEDVMDFMLCEWEEVKKSEAWKELKRTNPHLVEELLDRMQYRTPVKRLRFGPTVSIDSV